MVGNRAAVHGFGDLNLIIGYRFLITTTSGGITQGVNLCSSTSHGYKLIYNWIYEAWIIDMGIYFIHRN